MLPSSQEIQNIKPLLHSKDFEFVSQGILLLETLTSEIQFADYLFLLPLLSEQTDPDLYKTEGLLSFPRQRKLFQKGRHWYYLALWSLGTLARFMEMEEQNRQLDQLRLSHYHYSTLPSSIQNLRYLRKIHLRNNKLDEFPEVLQYFKNLVYLDIGENALTELPDFICDYPNLTTLYLSDNSITALPEKIGKLQKLKQLDLGQNLLTRLPDSFKDLNLEECLLTGNDFPEDTKR